MKRDELHIDEPCSARWSEMSGAAQTRFCSQCSKHVHDLSAMTEPEARQVIQTVAEPCVRYTSTPDGTIRFKPTRRGFLARASMLAGGLAIGLPAAAAVLPAEGSEGSLLDRLAGL